MDNRRPCYILLKDKKVKALFHQWASVPFTGGAAQTLAIVEYEDGAVGLHKPKTIKFADGGSFEAFVFLDLEETDDGQNQLNQRSS